MNIRKLNLLASLCFAIASLTGCNDGGSQPAPEKTSNAERIQQLTTSLAQLHDEITTLTEENDSCLSSVDCGVLGLGDFNGCGTPDAFLVRAWALTNPNGDLKEVVDAKVDEYNRLDIELDALSGSSAECSSAPEQPAIACIRSRCTTDPEKVAEKKKKIAETESEMERLKDDIDALVGDASCADITDCKTMATSSPLLLYCSSPADSSYPAFTYSALTTDTETLQEKVNEYTQLHRVLHFLTWWPEGSTWPDVCVSAEIDTPLVGCIANRCSSIEPVCATPSEKIPAADTNSAMLKQEIEVLVGEAACTQGIQCGGFTVELDIPDMETPIIGIAEEITGIAESIPFSTQDTNDVASLACKVEQYARSRVREMGLNEDAARVVVQRGSCVQSVCR